MAQAAAVTAPHTWAVTNQEEEPGYDENGRPVTFHHVHFRTNTGHESHVTLPDTHFSAANVAAEINAKAAEMVRVHHMNSSNQPLAE